MTWELRTAPYPHAVLADALPPEILQRLLNDLPRLRYRRYTHRRRRYSAPMPEYLRPAVDELCRSAEQAAQDLPNRGFDSCKWECNLCQDRPGYSIDDHTDKKKKHITLLVYLVGHVDDGTVLKDTPVPFVPNTALMFVPMDNTVHCVRKTSSARHTLQLFLKEHTQSV